MNCQIQLCLLLHAAFLQTYNKSRRSKRNIPPCSSHGKTVLKWMPEFQTNSEQHTPFSIPGAWKNPLLLNPQLPKRRNRRSNDLNHCKNCHQAGTAKVNHLYWAPPHPYFGTVPATVMGGPSWVECWESLTADACWCHGVMHLEVGQLSRREMWRRSLANSWDFFWANCWLGMFFDLEMYEIGSMIEA